MLDQPVVRIEMLDSHADEAHRVRRKRAQLAPAQIVTSLGLAYVRFTGESFTSEYEVDALVARGDIRHHADRQEIVQLDLDTRLLAALSEGGRGNPLSRVQVTTRKAVHSVRESRIGASKQEHASAAEQKGVHDDREAVAGHIAHASAKSPFAANQSGSQVATST